MKRSIFATPVVASAILVFIFAAAFATYNTTREGSSSATNKVGCAVGTQYRIFFQDQSRYSGRWQRMIRSDNGDLKTRVFGLPNGESISPGEYEVRAISSDNHFTHRSSAPDLDVQNQPNEEFFFEIDGQRTPNYTTDFTDYYDWRGGPGELIQDDDFNIDSVPQVVRDTWQGEYLGNITVTNNADSVTAVHRAKYDDSFDKFKINSVIPSGIVLDCVPQGSPSLSVEKSVDGNQDNVFSDTLEAAQVGSNVTWKVVGTNNGDAEDDDARMRACVPAGTSYVASSAVAGGGSVNYDSSSNCINWQGSLDEGQSAEFTFQVTLNDFAACDAADGTTDERCTCDAIIFSDATSTDASSPADTDTAQVEIERPELVIEKLVDGNDDAAFSNSEAIVVGQNNAFKWRVTVNNTNDVDADQVRIEDQAASGVQFTGATVIDSSGVNQSNNGLVNNDAFLWEGSIDAGGFITFEIDSFVANAADFATCDANNDGSCLNEAVVSANIDTAYEEYDRDDASVTRDVPILTIEKSVDGNSDNSFDPEVEENRPGEIVTWQVVGRNEGPGNDGAVKIHYCAPAGTTFAEGTDGGNATQISSVAGWTSVTTNNCTEWTGPLEEGQSVTLQYQVVVNDFNACDTKDTEDNKCTNEAVIYSELTETTQNAPADEDDAAVTPPEPPRLTIEKTVDGNDDDNFTNEEEITAGTPFEWKIVATNAADAGLAKNAVIQDTLPSGLRFAVDSQSTDPISITTDSATQSGRFTGTSDFSWTGDIEPGGSVELVFSTVVDDYDAFVQCDDAVYAGNSLADGKCHNMAEVGLADNPGGISISGQPLDSDGADVTASFNPDLRIVKSVDGIDDDNSAPGRFSDNDPEEILAGTNFTWQIVASNVGDGPLDNARIVSPAPAGLTMVGDADDVQVVVNGQIDEGAVSVVNGTLVWNGSLAVNASVTLIYDAVVADLTAYADCVAETAVGDENTCSCEATLGQAGNSSTNFSDTVATVMDPAFVYVDLQPELEVEKTVDANNDDVFTDREELVNQEQAYTWQITGCNVGNALAENVVLYPGSPIYGNMNDVYVPGSATVVDGPTGTVSEQVNDGVTTFAWRGQLAAAGAQDSCVTIQYESTTSTANSEFQDCDLNDPNVANSEDQVDDNNCVTWAEIGFEVDSTVDVQDTADAEVYIVPEGLLTVQKTVDGNGDGTFGEQEEIRLGEEFTYKVVVTNEGDAAVENAAMRDPLPEGVVSTGTPSLSPADLGAVDVQTGDKYLVFWTAQSLEPGQSVEIFIPATIADQAAFDACDGGEIDGSQDDICTNTAAAGTGTSDEDWQSETDPDPADVVVMAEPDLYITKTVDGIDADEDFTKVEEIFADGTDFTYRVTFGNIGDATAENVVVTTGLLPGVTYVSNTQAAEGTTTFTSETGLFEWTGDLNPGQELSFDIVVRVNSFDEFGQCDRADRTEDLQCVCPARLVHGDTDLQDKAVVTTERPETPRIEIDKLVDGNNDGSFSQTEDIQVGDEISWQVRARNTGSVDANNIKITDSLIAGMKFVPGSLSEIRGAEFGTSQLDGDDVVWEGTIPASQEIILEFKTVFSSLSGYQQCNFSDGDAEDEQCTNPVTVEDSTTGQVLGTNDANVKTEVGRVLANTGAIDVNYVVVVGVVIAAITLATAVIAYVTRPRQTGGPGEVVVEIIPSSN